ncbi:PIN domain-like protein [Mycena haematopus]|nr:PIN domain-like protein [Mycena haematopus]
MGIDGLWKELELVEQKISLPNLAVSTGFIGNATGARGFRVGIDASGWMYRACARHGITESPELVALFSRCSRLFRLPFIPIFVFDGPERPRVKRGKLIRGNDHPLARPFQSMLEGFGFQWITARGEAEATLSRMTTTGVPVSVDAILTDDSDSFVFGADVVLRIRSEDNENYEASRYSAHDISEVLGLSHDDFILVAILAGGDYSDGLAQCGVATAIGLARAGLGKQLIAGLSGKSYDDCISFLATWRQTLQAELETNSSGHLPHRYKQLAANIPPDFPDLAVINLYRYPVVTDHEAVASLVFHPPRLDILARFAEAHFQWGDSIGILEHFAAQLFAGLVIRELVDRASAADGFAAPLTSPPIIKRIVGNRRHKSTGYLAELRLTLNIDRTILTSALQALSGRRNPSGVRVWIPKSTVEHVFPSMVLDYTCRLPTRTSRKRKAKTTVIDGSSLSSSSSTTAILGHGLETVSSSARSKKRYNMMIVTYQGREEVELISDSDGEF